MTVDKANFYTTQSGQRPGGSSLTQQGKDVPAGDFLTMLFSIIPTGGTDMKDAGVKTTVSQDSGALAKTTLASVDYKPQDDTIDPALLGLPQAPLPLTPVAAEDAPEDGMAILLDALDAALKGGIDMNETADIAASVSARAALTPAETVRKQKDFMAFLQHLLTGVPENERMMALDINQSFEISQDKPGAETAQALIATGLTPEELTRFMEELAKRLPQADSLMAGMVRLQPAPQKAEALFTPRAMIVPQAQSAAPLLAAEAAEQSIETKLDALMQGQADEAAALDGEESSFDRILKTLEMAQQKGGAATQGQTAPAAAGAQLSTVAATSLPPGGMTFGGGLSGQIYPDGLGWENFAAATPGQTMTVTGTAALTSLTGYAPSAAQPHPATQAITATISKAAVDGETKNITVKLDPPELGRVEIRLEFGKDKNVKAHLVVEKPETYMMLQRDAQILERSLHDAGMTMDDGGVSFELAQDGGLSGERRGQGNDSGGGSTDTGTEEETAIIETSVDWYVDPDTGMTRYNLTA